MLCPDSSSPWLVLPLCCAILEMGSLLECLCSRSEQLLHPVIRHSCTLLTGSMPLQSRAAFTLWPLESSCSDDPHLGIQSLTFLCQGEGSADPCSHVFWDTTDVELLDPGNQSLDWTLAPCPLVWTATVLCFPGTGLALCNPTFWSTPSIQGVKSLLCCSSLPTTTTKAPNTAASCHHYQTLQLMQLASENLSYCHVPPSQVTEWWYLTFLEPELPLCPIAVVFCNLGPKPLEHAFFP